ncbi:hypothetical protein [Enterocloster lavalensis]|uniref:hypothetical protein n=1 Tax=Enterocloster lavalensis TaxID=460384 RepID=UPI000D1B1DFE|nr:hypothetical protein [Enterocloster lavalensis]PST27706.1 hypothetical protein C7256_29580 [Enterocloster lavalensis]
MTGGYQETALKHPGDIAGNQSALRSRNQTIETAESAIIQRVPQLWEIAKAQAEKKARQYQFYLPDGVSLDYHQAMLNYRKLGFSSDIFSVESNLMHRMPQIDWQQYFTDCIKKYYGAAPAGFASLDIEAGEGLGGDSWIMNTHMHEPEKRVDELLGSQLAPITFVEADGNRAPSAKKLNAKSCNTSQMLVTILKTVLFPGGKYLFDEMQKLPGNPQAAGKESFTFANPLSGLGTTAHSFKRAVKIANRMMPAGNTGEPGSIDLPKLKLEQETADRLGGYESYRGGPRRHDRIKYNSGDDAKRTHTRTFVHEMAHHFEAYMGAEDMVRLYRELYARTANYQELYQSAPGSLPKLLTDYTDANNNITEPGIGRTGDTAFGLTMYLPKISPNPQQATQKAGSTSDQMTYASQSNRYPATLSARPNDHGALSSRPHFGTEFLSTTAELLTAQRNASLLIATDPLRVALFLKFVNPKVYQTIKTTYQEKINRARSCIERNQFPAGASKKAYGIAESLNDNLDEVLHVS